MASGPITSWEQWKQWQALFYFFYSRVKTANISDFKQAKNLCIVPVTYRLQDDHCQVHVQTCRLFSESREWK